MRDISARELKGHNILAVERFRDSTPCFSPRMATGRPWTPSAASKSKSSGMPTL